MRNDDGCSRWCSGGAKEKKRREGEESQENSRAESCPRVDVTSDINVARQRDTREKSRLGWHIIRHASLETDFDREGRMVSPACERKTDGEDRSFARGAK